MLLLGASCLGRCYFFVIVVVVVVPMVVVVGFDDDDDDDDGNRHTDRSECNAIDNTYVVLTTNKNRH